MGLIEQFKAQSRGKIWTFLRHLANEEQTAMRELTFLGGALEHNGLYLYYQHDEAVVLLVDTLQPTPDEIIDEECFGQAPPLWFSEASNRVSPVYRLRQVMHLLYEACQAKAIRIPRIQGVLLTFSNLLNYDDMEEYLDNLRVTVLNKLDFEMAPLRLRSNTWQTEMHSKVLNEMQVLFEQTHDHKLTNLIETWIPKSRDEGIQEELKKLDKALKELKGEQDDDSVNEHDNEHDNEQTDKPNPLKNKRLKFKIHKEEPLFFSNFGDEPVDDPFGFGTDESTDTDEDEPFDLDEDDPDLTDDWCVDDGYTMTPEEEAMKEFEDHMEVVKEELNEQYADFMGNNSLVSRIEVRPPSFTPDEEFDKLVGCKKIRRQVMQLTTMSRYNERIAELDPLVKCHNLNLHSIFTGNPGVGKSTVCKLYGSLLRQAGALKYGHVVVCDRSTFVGTHWGDEEKAVRVVMQMARGGVLMIDEAYQLMGDMHPHDPGRLVMPLMMSALADPEWSDIAVVLCGYPKPMELLLDQNPGLLSRFPNRFHFRDFKVKELEQITLNRIAEYGYRFTRAAWAKYCWFLRDAYDQRNERWANARFIANWLDRIYICHAQRCEDKNITSRRQLRVLAKEDVCLPDLIYMKQGAQ